MDVVLGVAVTGPVARLALIGSGAEGSDVIDQSVVDLADNPIEKLTETVVGTNRLLADENHRLVGTRLCWTDHPRADQLRQALEDSGVHNVAVLSESQAVTALMRAAGRPGAVLVMDDTTATLSVLGSATGTRTRRRRCWPKSRLRHWPTPPASFGHDDGQARRRSRTPRRTFTWSARPPTSPGRRPASRRLDHAGADRR